MRCTILNKLLIGAAAFGLGIAGAATNPTGSGSDTDVAKKLTHELRMYPHYSIFDNVSFTLNGGRVDLLGEVSEPYKKADLERLAQRAAGVTSLSNDIKVSPLSPMDNRLRIQVARAIYGDPVLSQYRLQPIQPVHIIVDNGHVTLEGVVRTELEKAVAGLRASEVGLEFGPVENNLHVENPSHKS